MGAAAIFAKELAKLPIEIGQREGGLPGCPRMALASMYPGRVQETSGYYNGGEEAFDATAAARVSRRREDQPHLDIGSDLFEVRAGEVAAVVGIEHLKESSV
jgi:hypothetical protein